MFILASVGKPLFTCFGGGDDTGSLNEGVGQGGFPVVDCDNIGQSKRRDIKSERTCVPWAITDIFLMFAGLSMSARILNHVSHPPTQAKFATHHMHTSSTVKLYEAIVLAISRTIDACSDFEQPQYQTRPDTSLEQGGPMVTLFARESGMDLLDHLNGVLYEKLLLFFFSGSTPLCRTEG